MNKQEIIDYVMNTPHNVNRTILSQSLDEIGSSSSADLTLLFDYNAGPVDNPVDMESGRVIAGSMDNLYSKIQQHMPVKIELYAVDSNSNEYHLLHTTSNHVSGNPYDVVNICAWGFFVPHDGYTSRWVVLEPNGTTHPDWG